jgi:BlaI family transcriptional regulator, penicillinase repressor
MPRDRQDVTEAEMSVMQVLWDAGPRSIRQITDAVHGARADTSQYATVQKQLERLEAKRLVRRDRSLFVHLFRAAVGREELIGRRLREMADKLCGGSLAPILSHLARSQRLSAEERRALRELIESPGGADAPPAPPAPPAKGSHKRKG